MDDLLLQVGVGGILAVLVLREVFGYLKTRRDSRPPKALQDDDRRKLDDLHRWHARVDSDGVPVWHVRADMREAVVELARSSNRLEQSLERQTEILERQTKLLEEIHKDWDAVARRMT